MALAGAFQRRVKANKQDEALSDYTEEDSHPTISEDSGGADSFLEVEGSDVGKHNGENGSFEGRGGESEDDESDEADDTAESSDNLKHNKPEEHHLSESDHSSSEEQDPRQALSSISFGALASAQQSLGLKRKRSTSDSWGGKRIRSPSPFHEAEERRSGKNKPQSLASTRPSKHAPTETSSKKAVSRKRQIVAVPKIEARDPRFSSLSGNLDVNRVSQKYAFLDDYRTSEITDLKQQVRSTKDVAAKEALKRELKSMEDRERARRRAEEEKAVIREHRKRERERIEQGKKPFFLKKGEIKKQALVNRFEGMGEKKAEKVVEKRRKKKAKKEKRSMPQARRNVN